MLDKIRGANNGDNSGVEFTDDIQGDLTPDPAPSKAARSGRSGENKPAPKRVSPAVRKQLADEIEAYLLLGSGAWSMRDPYCGEVLEKQAREISVRLAAILGKNAQIVQWLHTSGVIGEWVALALAIKPVVEAIRDHHITKKVGNDEPDALDITQYGPYRPGP